MDKENIVSTTLNHTVQIVERKSIVISGVKKIESFNEEEFLLVSSMGYIIVKGEGLELLKLDTINGTISIKGKIESLNYLEDSNKRIKAESIIAKLFKWV